MRPFFLTRYCGPSVTIDRTLPVVSPPMERTVQTLRPEVPWAENATFHIQSLAVLKQLLR